MRLVTVVLLLVPFVAFAQEAPRCPDGSVWDPIDSMCKAPPEKVPRAVPEGLPAPDLVMPAGHEHMHHEHGEHAAHMHHQMLSNAAMFDAMSSPDTCGPGEYFFFDMSMCLDRPLQRGRFSGMVMANAFLVDTGVTGVRSRHSLAGPNWLMFVAGLDVASWNRVEVDGMFTIERWTFPQRGYALPLQIGEENAQGVPFIDAQHPHSSPLMGLSIVDVISLSHTENRLLHLWFSPRGASTDGPIPFMHRMSATFDPSAPLGHHLGQDAGHISSTVIAAGLWLGRYTLEVSTFNGREPQPTDIDLPIGTPDSVAVRGVVQIDRRWMVSASFAYVDNPEGDPTDTKVYRASASAYLNADLPGGWRAHATLIYGGIATTTTRPG
jgi:hypothetical protein